MRTRAVALAGAAVLAMGLNAACSAAATTATWTVRPGGGIIAQGTAARSTLTDTTTGSILTCATLMAGTLKRGSGLPGTGIGKITAAGYDCATPTTSPSLVSRGLPWHLDLISYDARTGVSRGTIGHLQLAFSAHGCSALINGTGGPASDGVVAVTFSNQTGQLTILPGGATLHWSHVHGCTHMAASGDPATLSAAYTLYRRQAITSP